MRRSLKPRHVNGVTMMELVVAALLMGATFAAIGELVTLNTFAVTKLTNKEDGLASARWAIDRIASDIRSSRTFGDFYASAANRNTFPDASNNPLYGSQIPSGGWPAAWGVLPYQLNSQCLILQQPVFYQDPANDPSSFQFNPLVPNNPENGFPIMISANSIAPGNPAADLENLDTTIYQLVPDPDSNPSGLQQYMLQIARYPGQTPMDTNKTLLNTTTRPLVNPPQTILRGIIGPKDVANPSGPPTIFHYYSGQSTPPQLLTTTGTVPASQVPAIVGISIDLELYKPDAGTTSSSAPANPEVVGVHAEAFMRANRNIVLSNFSSP